MYVTLGLRWHKLEADSDKLRCYMVNLTEDSKKKKNPQEYSWVINKIKMVH